MAFAPRAAARNDAVRAGLRLSPGSLVAVCFLAITAIALAYVGGVMSGRSYIVRQTEASRQEQMAALHAHEAETGELGDAVSGDADDQRILSPADLGFVRALRSDMPPDAATEATQSPAAVAPALPKPQEAAPPPLPTVPERAESHAQSTAMYDHVFQVAAFKDEDSVDALRQRLEGHGLRTRMQREGRLYLVRVLLRGDQTRAEEVVALMEQMRLGKPLLVSRKAVVLP